MIQTLTKQTVKKALALATIQDLMNKAEEHKNELIKEYAQILFENKPVAFVFAQIKEEIGKMEAYRACSELIQD